MFAVSGGQRQIVTCLSAAALIAVAGCASGSGSAPPSPKQAILVAAIQAQKITSATETMNIQFSGAQSGNATATARLRLKPALEASEDLTETVAGNTLRLKEVLTRTAMYVSEPSLARQAGKPWVKIELSALKGTPESTFAQLWQDLENNDFANQDQMLTVAKNAHLVGRQTVDGVPATEYAGSFTAAQALKALSAPLRKTLSPALQAMGGNTVFHFRVWIDDQHQTRKLVETETVRGENINTTVNITGINQPVDIVLPPSGQTRVIPRL
jgi:hypothetical protein